MRSRRDSSWRFPACRALFLERLVDLLAGGEHGLGEVVELAGFRGGQDGVQAGDRTAQLVLQRLQLVPFFRAQHLARAEQAGPLAGTVDAAVEGLPASRVSPRKPQAQMAQAVPFRAAAAQR